MPSDFIQKTVDAFSKIKEEIDEKGGELDFRHSLTTCFLRDVLGWRRKKGEGHFVIREKEDILLFDDSNTCVALVETKNPKIKLRKAHLEELKGHLDDTKTARYGALTNGHLFQLFEYSIEGELSELASIDISSAVKRGTKSLSKSERQDIYLLRRLMRDRFVGVKPEYFTKTAQKVPVEKKFDLFIENLRESLDDLTRIIDRFFRFYQESGLEHYSGKFLREEAFPKWKGASTGEEEELQEKFCKETAYVFLNRILFTRILEDKEIVPRLISGKGLTDSLRLYGEGAYEGALRQAYKNVEKFYEHFYEFGIFDWWRLPEHEREMSAEDEEVQEELESELHSVVVQNILKRLNQFNFREVGRDILGDVYQEYLPPAERKRLGEFYTPIEVVRYILDAVGYTSENKLEEKLLLDPACGSGTFLVEATSRLIERHDKKGARLRDPDDCKRVLNNIISNIHGLDINPFACHIAEMNLLFTVIDLLHAVQLRYKTYNLDRFKVCQTDSLLPPGEESVTIREFVNGRIRSWAEETKRATQVKERQFDFVVGNPPYVNIKRIPEKNKKLYKKRYTAAYQMFDLYVLFVEEGINRLEKGGKLGFIIPSKFLAAEYGKKLRNFILDNCSIKQLVDVSYVEVFGETTPYPIISIFKLEDDKKQRVSNAIRGVHVWKDDRKILAEIAESINTKSSFFTPNFDIYLISQNRFYKNPSNIFDLNLSDDQYTLIRKIEEKSVGLGDICSVLVGIQTKKRVTGASKAEIVVKPKDYEKIDPTTRKLCRKKLDGGGVHRYRVKWDGGYLIYDRTRLYHSPPEDVFETPKILVKDISKEPRATYDDEGYYCFDTVYIVSGGGKGKEFNLKYILSIINSKLMHFYYLKRFSPAHVGGGYLRFRRPFLTKFPIKKTSKKIQRKVAALVDKTLSSNKRLNELEEKIENFPETYTPKLTKKLSEAAEDYKTLTRDKYKIRSPKIGKSGKGLYKLSLDKDNYVTFASRELAEYVLEWLKHRKRVRRRELLGLEVPSEKEVVKVMKEFSDDQERVKELRGEVKRLEGEIDQLVYGLYRLNEKERNVVEDFLKKF